MCCWCDDGLKSRASWAAVFSDAGCGTDREKLMRLGAMHDEMCWSAERLVWAVVDVAAGKIGVG